MSSNNKPYIKIKPLDKDLFLAPSRAYRTCSGFDLYAQENCILEVGETKMIPTGFSVEIPEGYEIQIRPRSGLTLKTPFRVHFGTVDSEYRGEVGIIASNEGVRSSLLSSVKSWIKKFQISDEDFKYPTKDLSENCKDTRLRIYRGDRIAQMVLNKVSTNDIDMIEIVNELSETSRGSGGFGSTGVKNDELKGQSISKEM